MTYRAHIYFPSLPDDRVDGSGDSPVLALADAMSALGLAERPLSYQARHTPLGVLEGYDGLPGGLVASLEVVH